MARIRYIIPKAVLATLSPSAERVAVEERTPPDVLRRLHRALPISWAPRDEYMALLGAVVDVIGEDRVRDHFRKTYLQVSRGTLLGPITEGLIRVYRGTPPGVARGAPRAWDMVAQGMGTITAEVVPRVGTRVLFAYDPALDSRSGVFVNSFAGTFDGFYDRCGVEGRCVVESLDANAGTATYLLPHAE
ncbi:MAG: hypothetical protein ACE37F_02095 [Nannocystaceae bacterium]|nr:hypothetical protein [bacterium]